PPRDSCAPLCPHRTSLPSSLVFFFFNDTPPTDLSPLSLHDALPISAASQAFSPPFRTSVSTGHWRASRSWCSPVRMPLAHIRIRSEEHTSELQSLTNLVCRLLLEKKKKDEHPSTANQEVAGCCPSAS